jgi:hypothetical protein
MDNDSPSTAPEERGDNQSATNQASDKQDSKPEKEIRPRRRQSRKVFGFSETKFREFAGYFILIGWLWYDLIDSHGKIVKLCFLAASLTVAQGLACLFLKSWRKAIAVWVISEVLVAVVVWENSRPEPKPYPHFILSLSTSDDFDDNVELTNDFLFSTNGQEFKGCVFFPIKVDQPNIELSLHIINDSSNEGESVQVAIFMPTKLKCVPASGWIKRYNPAYTSGTNALGIYGTNLLQSWGFFVPEPIFPSNGAAIYALLIPLKKQTVTSCSMMIEFMAKDIPRSTLSFSLAMIPIPKNLPPDVVNSLRKPFVQQARMINGISENNLPYELLNEYKRENIIREDY